jgi:hypothetical protein
VYRYSIEHCFVISLICTFLIPSNAAFSKPNPAQAAAANAQAEQARQQQLVLQQQQMRKAQMQQVAAQQQQARQVQEQQLKAQEESRKSQEQALRAQEEQARNNQQQAMKAQQEEAKRIQEQQASNLQKQAEQRAQAQAEGARQQQKAQQEALKNQQKEQQQLARAQQKEQQRAEQQALKAQQEGAGANKQREMAEEVRAQQLRQQGTAAAEIPRAGNELRAAQIAAAAAGNRAFRPVQARPVPTEHIIPMSKGMSMPVLEENVAAAEKEHAQAVVQNLKNHLIPVQMDHAPANLLPTKAMWMNNYTNNYWSAINNQRFAINRQNTYVNSVMPADYPYWYQPEPGWQFSNGFVLGNMVRANLDWLRWGWHPYYGPQPDGFVCADDYVPTAWMYVPAYGLWMQPGVYGWAEAGPPYDYTGPITVEVLEPRHVHVKDPYNGWERGRVTNVIYLYNAFFYPEEERWGYVNRHGYFVWLNL